MIFVVIFFIDECFLNHLIPDFGAIICGKNSNVSINLSNEKIIQEQEKILIFLWTNTK